MRTPVTCAACRLHRSIRTQAISRQRRQLFSTTAKRAQAADDVDTLYERFEAANQQPHGPRRDGSSRYSASRQSDNVWQNPSRDRNSRPTPSRRDHDGSRYGRSAEKPAATEFTAKGRYSGRPAPSQNLLEDLAAPHRERNVGSRSNALDTGVQSTMIENDWEDTAQQQEDSSSDLNLSESTQDTLPHSVSEAAKAFVQNRTGSSVDQFSHLQTILQDWDDTQDLRVLGRDLEFRSAHYVWSKKACASFINGLHVEIKGETVTSDLPSPTVALNVGARMYYSTGLWRYALWRLSDQTAAMLANDDPNPSTTRHAIQRGTEELMSVWSLFMAEKRGQSVKRPLLSRADDILKPPPTDFTHLPQPALFQETLDERGSSRSLQDVLGLLVVPGLKGEDMDKRNNEFVSPALVTLKLLQQEVLPSNPAYQPWKTLLETILSKSTLRPIPWGIESKVAQDDGKVREFYENLIEEMSLQWKRPRTPSTNRPQIPSQNEDGTKENEADELNASGLSSFQPLLDALDQPAAITEASTELDRFVDMRVKKLGRALEQRKVTFAMRELEMVRNYGSSGEVVRLPLLLYEHLLVTFLGLRDQRTALEVWKDMINAGHQPTKKTYTIVMRGSQYVGDYSMLQSFWTAMRNAGIQPDHHAWSTRISSLIRRGKPEDGLTALNEMSQEWIAAAREVHTSATPAGKKKQKGAGTTPSSELIQQYKEDIGEVPRPGLVAMNAAVSGLASVQDKLIPKVITWGRVFGIQPDLHTYNQLINVAMRRNRSEEAFALLKRMDQLGIQADQTTWTVLLTAMFQGGFLDDLDHQAQQNRILQFIESLEVANQTSPLNNKSYALIVDRLLKFYNNASAAEAVLQHMYSKNVQPTAHIYTILMTSHFASDPPNFLAVESLWSSIRSESSSYGAKLDSQFYDRMVEGYATHHRATGSTRPMLHFLQRMQNEGKKPSWKALTCAAKALAERGEWPRLRAIVQNAKRGVEASVSQTQRFGAREFWTYVASTGIIEAKEVPIMQMRD